MIYNQYVAIPEMIQNRVIVTIEGKVIICVQMATFLITTPIANFWSREILDDFIYHRE